MGSASTAKLRYVFPSGYEVKSGATLAIADNVNVLINNAQTIAVDGGGAMTVGATTVVLDDYNNGGYGITVAGTLTATNSSFSPTRSAFGTGSGISIYASGQIHATNTYFGWDAFRLYDGNSLAAGDLANDTFQTIVYAPGTDIPLLAGPTLTANKSFQDIDINAGSLNTGTLTLGLMGSASTAKLRYVFPSGYEVKSGATLAIADNVNVLINNAQTIAVDGGGAMTVGATTVVLDDYNNGGYGITVAGTLTATNSSFSPTRSAFGTGSGISIYASGQIHATNTYFGWDAFRLYDGNSLAAGDLANDTFQTIVYAPGTDIPLLAGPTLTANKSFQDIDINAGSLPSGTLTLAVMGSAVTANAKLRYVFPSGYEIKSGATLAIADNVNVFIPNLETIAVDSGANMTVGATTVLLDNYNGGGYGIVVAGTLTATGTSFTPTRLNFGTGSGITVLSGGQLAMTASTFAWDELSINGGADTGGPSDPSITGNDFSNVSSNGIVAVDNSSAIIYLTGNYWGVPNAQIPGKILDSNDPPVGTRPTVVFSPAVNNGPSRTVAAPSIQTFKTTDQTFNLTATVDDVSGNTINEGQVTFTVLDGTQVIGNTTTAANVSNGAAQAQYTLPHNTRDGLYTIQANYTDPQLNYLPSTDTLHYLTVNTAATKTSSALASATFSAMADQSVPVSAQVASTAGTINEGFVTFNILRGGTPVGASVTAGVLNNSASTSYDLLSGTPGGPYTIQAVYTDPVDFATSTNTNQLTVSAAPTTVAPSGCTATFNEISSEGVALSANVSSPAGTVNEGSVSFAIVDASSNKIAGPFVYSVANGMASGNASLPAGTPVGAYFINAVYNGTPSFASSLPSTSNLTVSTAATTTAASPASIGFSNAIQNVPLSATVMSTAGVVGEGTVTFTILANGSSPVGQPIQASVSAGGASASYPLPANTAIGLYTIQAVFTDTGSFSGSSDLTHYVTVTHPPATKLFLATAPSSTATAGTAFAAQPVIYEEDQYGNLEAGDNTTVVTVLLASGVGPLQGTLTATVSGGVATFTNLGDDRAEPITLLFASGNLTTATSGNIVVSPAAASKLVVTQQPSSSAIAGIPFATQPVVKEEDQYGNVITTDSAHTVTAARGAIGTDTLLGGPLTVTLSGGVATFGGLSYDKAETMNISFTTNASGVSSTASNNIIVSPANASKLVITQQPSATATAGQPFGAQPVIYEEDQFNNVLTNDNSTVIAAMLNSGTGPLQGTIERNGLGRCRPFHRPRRQPGRDHRSGVHQRQHIVVALEPDCRQCRPGRQAGDPDPALDDSDRRAIVRGPARNRAGRFQWQPRGERQHLSRDRVSGQRQRHAPGDEIGDRG